eukprot:5143938-Pyramimonas_sp.AAC.1
MVRALEVVCPPSTAGHRSGMVATDVVKATHNVVTAPYHNETRPQHTPREVVAREAGGVNASSIGLYDVGQGSSSQLLDVAARA